ncbi:hypothetical protein LVD17_22040 [Fulvivirga ulvae]|uniref:hypothetical protein n=1 Tax=Fulvivirga ulvae TaxID=2904245 RepID=UPI001F3878FB|nr:hypothetical protein [Fulvivirga ulvae]UII30978.1 hypothetical protein LVD17_22040 [Fulvivirga ulvae]
MEYIDFPTVERKMDVIKNKCLAIICLAGCLLFYSNLYAQNLTPRQSTTPSNIRFWEYLPAGYQHQGKKSPAIFFLHGKGERGDGSDSSMQIMLKHGPLKQIQDNDFGTFKSQGKNYSFIVLAPQLDQPNTFWEPEYVDEFISYALSEYNIDPERIYLTGLSMGGNGTWNYAYSNYNAENKFAAIAPIAGWGSTNKACIVKERNIPVWVFHGEDDKTVPFVRGKAMFNAIDSCKNGFEKDYKFTAYKNTGHNSWQKAYDLSHKWNNPNIYEWFLSHKLNKDQSSVLSKSLGLKSNVIASSANEHNAKLDIVCPLPRSLNEVSGLIRDSNGVLWAHNDSYNGPYIMQLDTSGTVTRFKKVIFSSNFDWEDLAVDHEDNIYIGDIGNNENNRKKLYIYKLSAKDTAERIKAETISFTYPDQKDFPPSTREMNYDSEAIVYYQNALYTFSKNRTSPFTGIVRVYKVPATPGDYEAELVDSLKLESGPMHDNWITGADISPDGQTIALLSHRKIWLINCFDGKKFSQGKITKIVLDSFTQKEAITFMDDQTLYIADEKFKDMLGGYLYKVNISTWLSNDCN